MSILIKGMDMPKSCNECRFGKEKQLDVGIICTLLDGTTFDTTSRPTSMCPLIELPPHGDLIDIDRLLLEVNNLIDSEKSILQIVSEAETLIRNAPVVIESEE